MWDDNFAVALCDAEWRAVDRLDFLEGRCNDNDYMGATTVNLHILLLLLDLPSLPEGRY